MAESNKSKMEAKNVGRANQRSSSQTALIKARQEYMKKLNKYEQLILNLNKASQELKEATNKAIQTLDTHAEKVEAIHQEAMSK